MYIRVLEYLCKTVLTIEFEEAVSRMYSVKNVFYKFQAKFFRNNFDWAHFLKNSRLLAFNFTKNELLHKSFQEVFLEYQNILFPEKPFMGHSCQRVPNTSYVMKTPRIAYPTFLRFYPSPLSCCLQPSPPLLFWCLVSLTEWLIEPHLMCYFT